MLTSHFATRQSEQLHCELPARVCNETCGRKRVRVKHRWAREANLVLLACSVNSRTTRSADSLTVVAQRSVATRTRATFSSGASVAAAWEGLTLV